MHLVEDAEAQQALDAAVDEWSGALVAWEAATWVVLRDPGIGDPLGETGRIRVFTYEGARSIDQPTITLIYEKVGETTFIRAARFVKAAASFSGRA